MTQRTIRRAQERKTRKEMERRERNQLQQIAILEQRTESQDPAFVAAAESQTYELFTTPELPPTKPISEARLAANRANAQLSTGPTSQNGRAKTCLNAVKTALTGRTVLLSSDDAALYEQHILAYTKELRPLTQRECDLVQSIADTAWRLKRIPALEMALFAQGRIEFAESFNDHAPAARPGLIELKTFLSYERQLRNLQLQESRLACRYEKDTEELRTIQAERDARDHQDLDACAKLYLAAQHDCKPFHPSDYGFEFSTLDIESYLEGVRAANITRANMLQHREANLKTAQGRSHAA